MARSRPVEGAHQRRAREQRGGSLTAARSSLLPRPHEDREGASLAASGPPVEERESRSRGRATAHWSASAAMRGGIHTHRHDAHQSSRCSPSNAMRSFPARADSRFVRRLRARCETRAFPARSLEHRRRANHTYRAVPRSRVGRPAARGAAGTVARKGAAGAALSLRSYRTIDGYGAGSFGARRSNALARSRGLRATTPAGSGGINAAHIALGIRERGRARRAGTASGTLEFNAGTFQLARMRLAHPAGRTWRSTPRAACSARPGSFSTPGN